MPRITAARLRAVVRRAIRGGLLPSSHLSYQSAITLTWDAAADLDRSRHHVRSPASCSLVCRRLSHAVCHHLCSADTLGYSRSCLMKQSWAPRGRNPTRDNQVGGAPTSACDPWPWRQGSPCFPLPVGRRAMPCKIQPTSVAAQPCSFSLFIFPRFRCDPAWVVAILLLPALARFPIVHAGLAAWQKKSDRFIQADGNCPVARTFIAVFGTLSLLSAI
jgi:hypothetical protein